MALNALQLILLTLSTMVLLLVPESKVAFQVIIFGGTAITLHVFYRLMRHDSLLRFGNIACFSTLFGYVVSTAGFTILSLVKYGQVSYVYNDFGLSFSQYDVSYALLIALLVSIVLSGISHFEKPIRLKYYVENGFSIRSLGLIALSTFFIVIGVLKGDIGYMGVYLENEKRISSLGALCFILIPPLVAITIAFILESSTKLKKYRKVLLLISTVLVIALIPLGRRVLMYSLILSLILIGPVMFKRFRKKKIKAFYVFFIVLAISTTLVWGFRVFYAIRITISRMAAEEKPPILDIVPYYLDLMQDSYGQAEVHEKLIENISDRPYILSYLAGLLHAHTHKSTPFLGELRHALTMAVPSVLYPEKTKRLTSAPEEFIHPSLGLPVFDGPNTAITAGLNDLWFIGAILYPIGIVVFYNFIYRAIPVDCPPFIFLFIALRLIYSILFFEDSLGNTIGSGLRDLFIVAIFYFLVIKIPSYRLTVCRLRKLYG